MFYFPRRVYYSRATIMVNASCESINQKPEKQTSQTKPSNKTSKDRKRSKLRIASDILESIDDYVSAFDREWNLIYINKKTANFFGCEPEELIGKNFWQTFPKFVGTVLEKNYREAMSKREIRRFEWETIYAHTGYREFTVFPSAEGITVYGVNITDRKKAEEEIARLASFPTLNPDSVVEIDFEGNVTYANPATKKLFPDLETSRLNHALLSEWKNVVKTLVNHDNKTFSREIKVNEHWYIEQFYLVSQHQRIRIYSVNVDERKKLQAQLEDYARNLEKLVEERTKQLQDKERLATIGETAGMVGHDIRNPLQSIVSSMFLIKNDIGNLPGSEEKNDALEELDSIREQISYMDKIVSDLQDYARPLRPDMLEVDLRALVRSALSTLHVPDNVEAFAYFDEKLPRLRTDPLLLKRVLLNLVTNAVQAMPKGGKLTVNAQTNDAEHVQITVEDTGVGISEENKAKLFTPLFTTKSKGQGFGLAVSKRIIEAQGGTINFESQVGKGTKFIIRLPIQTEKN